MAITELVFMVWHPLTQFGERYVSDLIFRDDKPLLVVEWEAARQWSPLSSSKISTSIR
jgi:hypothetical protein